MIANPTLQLDEVRQLYRELHAQVERLTEFHENNSKQVIDAVAEHNSRQTEKILGAWQGGTVRANSYTFRLLEQ